MNANTAHITVDILRERVERRRAKRDRRFARHIKRRHKSYIKKQIKKRIKELQYHADISIHKIDPEVIQYFEKRGYKITKQEHQYTIEW